MLDASGSEGLRYLPLPSLWVWSVSPRVPCRDRLLGSVAHAIAARIGVLPESLPWPPRIPVKLMSHVRLLGSVTCAFAAWIGVNTWVVVKAVRIPVSPPYFGRICTPEYSPCTTMSSPSARCEDVSVIHRSCLLLFQGLTCLPCVYQFF